MDREGSLASVPDFPLLTQTPADDSEQAFLDRAVVIALGSNLPGAYSSSRDLLDAALKALEDDGLSAVRASSWWRSKAWPEGSGPDFLNGVALVEPTDAPAAVLAILHTIERSFGRERGVLNAARPLDLDLIAHGRLIARSAALTLPHPRAVDRRFVMGPLAEIAPVWVDPVSGETAARLSRRARVGRDARPDAPRPTV